jgi:hypothetical protein
LAAIRVGLVADQALLVEAQGALAEKARTHEARETAITEALACVTEADTRR